ncbi:hypothetical protein [Desulfobulbus alkaliphilus]|uniref:hypothetical protein n=1 Tax=Desulfobulbus alkaliphilus TaxID=869814 RepID=UPI001965102F|nr:hypothetical protein [Desulfobulbus alkaliphilus]MBM9538466.1 hypothetical protein [Desulfobulbus alkaliphilus]
MKIKTIVPYHLALLLVIFYWSAPSIASDVILTVTERYGVDRQAAPVTYGVPFSREDNLFSTNSLSIPGIQAQFRVLSRYEGAPDDTTRPIRVVLVDFQTDIEALESRQLVLRRDATSLIAPQLIKITEFTNNESIDHYNTAHASKSYNHLARVSPEGVDIDTGNAFFRISSLKGNLFDQVMINGVNFIESSNDNGFHIEFDGSIYKSSKAKPFNVEIEENGPLRCVVKVEGEFANEFGDKLIPPVTRVGTIPTVPIKYTIRYFAYKDKNYIKLQTTLRNENKGWTFHESRPIHNINIKQAFLKITLNDLSSQKFVNFDGYSDFFSEGQYSILQREISDGKSQNYKWDYSITKDGHIVSKGEKYDSYVSFGDSNKVLMVANRWFWQNHPAGITIKNDEMLVNLWPDARDFNWPPNDGEHHRILGGSWKTHDLLFSFADGDKDFTQEIAHIKNRLIARCSDTYYSQTEFFQFMAPKNIISGYTFQAGETLQDALNEHNNYHRALFDNQFIQSMAHPNSVFDAREKRIVRLTSNPLTYATWYGWLEFGGMPRGSGGGYHNQHYDWSFLSLLGFLRFSDYNMLEIAEEFLRHQADILVIHDPEAKPNDGTLRYEYHGGQRYELDALFSYNDDFGPYNSAPRQHSHFWTNGLTLQYLLTGEIYYLDVLEQSFEHTMRVKDSPTMDTSATRNVYRGIEGLVNGYTLTGDIKFLNTAFQMFEDKLLTREGGSGINDGQSGWIQSGAEGTISIIYDNMMIEPLIKLHISLVAAGNSGPAATLENFLIRWSDWAKNYLWKALDYGEYRNDHTEYFPHALRTSWLIEENTFNFSRPIDADNSVAYASLFAYRYQIDNAHDREQWMNLARSIFKDFHFYGNIADWTATRLNPTHHSHGTKGIRNNPGTGSWKIPKAITLPMLYVQQEFKNSMK